MTRSSVMYEGPVAGQSLTTEQGARPWERPAQISEPEEAVRYYMDKLTRPTVAGQLIDILETGNPATSLVDGLTIGGVMEGIHSIDVAVVIAPVIYNLVTSVADSAGIEYESGMETSKRNKMVDRGIVERAKRGREPSDQIADSLFEDEGEAIKEASMSLMTRPDQQQMVSREEEIRPIENEQLPLKEEAMI